jgi:tetratricopeptide (TPR) repeat protein
MPRPRPVSLRARYYILASAEPARHNPKWFQLSFDDWTTQTGLVTRGEAALVEDDLETAERCFVTLEGLARNPSVHPMALVDALIGRGDVARRRDLVGAAEALYKEAYEHATDNGLDFGRLRALIPWAVLQRRSRATSHLLPMLNLCDELAAQVGDEVYAGNTCIIRAEVLALERDFPGALAAADKAAEHHQGHPAALASLYVRLADTFRMQEDLVGLRRAVVGLLSALRTTRLPVERVDALDLLASLRMAQRQIESARVAAIGAVSQADAADYPRGAAYARMTLSQIERLAGNFNAALQHRRAAASFFSGRQDGQGSLAYCLIEAAELLILLDRPAEAAANVVEALEALEGLRYSQQHPSAQQEYRERFAQIYRRGIRLACHIEDPLLFVTVFEGLWGRRLIGLANGNGLRLDQDAVLFSHLLAQTRLAGTSTPESGHDRTIRLVGRTALTGSLPGMLDDAAGAAIAGLATPYDPQSARAHLEGIPLGTAALLLAPLPERPDRFVSLLVDESGRTSCGEYSVPESTRALLAEGPLLTEAKGIADLAPLSALLPEEISRIRPGTPLLIVPLEEFWPVPWTAIPVTAAHVLGQLHPIRICPSLSLAAVSRARTIPQRRRMRTWIGPDVRAHHLKDLPAAMYASSSEVVQDLCQGTPEQDVIVVAHGVPIHGSGHVLRLSDSDLVTPYSVMDAHAAGRVALITCWSAHAPGEQAGDPLNVATILLARGASSVLATSAELGDDVLSAFFVQSLLNKPDCPDWSNTLRDTIQLTLGSDDFRGRLNRWAPLRVLGAW